jgi:hypothetical protein
MHCRRTQGLKGPSFEPGTPWHFVGAMGLLNLLACRGNTGRTASKVQQTKQTQPFPW